ncbi:hypothetical protein D0962_17710 [Leptolyngbyaceae cyanobacterium CCMR0082]|uniref:Uncharacterized protein n=2 Tax=Adonisia TaxID=2950183 RepID=A0A6M0SA44_9CYAN|nr:hypothetical protein [Adonisia turfae CCMR0082]
MCSDNDFDEKKIRAITVTFLKGLLSAQVDKYIHLGGENGFEVSFSELKSLSDLFLKEIESQHLPEDEHSQKIGKNSQDLRDDLAYKLQQYSLPKGYELIVVATGVKSEESLARTGAWRSLSNLVKFQEWKKLSTGGAQPSNFFGAAIAIAVAAIVVVAIIFLVVLPRLLTPTPEVSPPPQEMNPSNPEEEVNPEQVDQNSSIRDLISLKKDLKPSVK